MLFVTLLDDEIFKGINNGAIGNMTKNIHHSKLRKSQLRHSSVPGTLRAMYLFGDPLIPKNVKNYYKNEYERKQGEVGSRREVDSYYDKHPDRKSIDAFSNLFPQVSKDPHEFAMDRAKVSKGEQDKNFEYETQIFKEMLEASALPKADSNAWKNFKLFKQALIDNSLENPLIPLMDYVDSNADRYFHDSELVIWLFLVLLEHQFLSYGCRVGFSETLFRDLSVLDDVAKFQSIEGHSAYNGLTPIDIWKPRSNDKGCLSTTRYNMMHYMIHEYAESSPFNRNIRHLYGKEFLKLKRGSSERGLCMNTALSVLDIPKLGNAAKDLFLLLFRSAEVFEMIQLVQFRVGRLPAKEIVENYSCFDDVVDDFYSGIKSFSLHR